MEKLLELEASSPQGWRDIFGLLSPSLLAASLVTLCMPLLLETAWPKVRQCSCSPSSHLSTDLGKTPKIIPHFGFIILKMSIMHASSNPLSKTFGP